MTANESFLAAMATLLGWTGVLVGYVLFLRWRIDRREPKGKPKP